MTTKKKPAPKRKPAPKKPAGALVALYEGLQANVFETVFAKDGKLIAAFLAWAKQAHPDWDDEVDDDDSPATRAVKLEMLITDEVDEAAFVAFFETLPAAQRKAAVAAMKDAGDEEEDEEVEDPAGAIDIAGVPYVPGAKSLVLQNRALTALPMAVCDLTELEHLDLSNNPIETLPPELARCTKLSALVVYGCKRLVLPALPGLRSVVAQNTSVALIKSLARSPTITTLNLMECGLTALPDELRKLTKLEYLDLSGNPIAKLPAWLDKLPIKTLHR